MLKSRSVILNCCRYIISFQSNKERKLFKNYVYGCFAYMCVHVLHVCMIPVLDPLKLDLQMIVSHHVGSGNRI